jgi:hypothetical protein
MADKDVAKVEDLDVEVVDDDNVLKLSKPLASGAKELVFDFDRVNGYVLIKCEKAAKREDPSIAVPALSMIFQSHVAAAAAKVRYDDILGLPAADFTAACVKAQAFLLSAGK